MNAQSLDDRAKRWAFAAIMIALVLDVADATIVNVALPAIEQETGAGATQMQWIVAGYFLSFGTLLLIGGRLGDIFGYRRLFLTGVGAFTLASIACGAAPDANSLVAARIVQGLAGAIMAPQVMAIVQILYSPLERVGRLAWFGLVGGLAAIIGPVLGGVLIDLNLFDLGWRTIFLINLPVGALAMALGWRFLPVTRSRRVMRLDFVGFAYVVGATSLLLIGVIEGPHLGWPGWCWAALAVSLGFGALIWRHATRRIARIGSAIIEPSLFGQRSFSFALVSLVAFSAAAAGFLMVFALGLQRGLGLTPFRTALLHIPFAAGVMLGVAVIGRRLVPLYGRWVVVGGSLLMAGGCASVFAVIGAGDTSPWLMVPLLLAAGTGMGLHAGPLPPIAVARVDADHAGAASAMIKTAQQVGSALGIAVTGAVYFGFAGTAGGAEALRGTQAAGAPGVMLLGGAVVAAAMLPRTIFPR